MEGTILDRNTCARARQSRDARFDGKFFIAVLSTGIYCRCICTSPRAREQNVRYFGSAAAAEAAGFRPCLRCRPECSPGSPAWRGTQTTVARALQLMEGSRAGGLEELAARLGVGGRHLRRLFVQHLGAPPSAVLRTRRLHFAKKLIEETSLPMRRIALEAGYGSVRRFNAGMRGHFRRSPTQLRRLAPRREPTPGNEYELRLPLRQPYDWAGMLAYLGARVLPGVEAVRGQIYRRTITVDGSAGFFEVGLETGRSALRVKVQIGEVGALYRITERIRAMFDVNADWEAIAAGLRGDPLLARWMRDAPGVRVPGCWDGFELALRALLEQRSGAAVANVLAGRIARRFGRPYAGAAGCTHLFPPPAVLLRAPLGRAGVGRAAGEAIRRLARAVQDGQIRLDGTGEAAEVKARLQEIAGAGKWAVEYVAMRALGEPDALPWDDAGLRRALGVEQRGALERRAEGWRPWRAYAAMTLWARADAAA